MANFNLTIDPAVNNAAAVAELVNAINTANENSEADTINLFPGGTYTLSAIDNSNSLNGNSGLPRIEDINGMTINGNGATVERASDAPDFRIFTVFGLPGSQPIFNLNNLTIRNGLASSSSASRDDGGAIFNYLGIVNITNSTFSDNSAGDGGGIFHNGGTLTVTNSTFSGNSATGSGGAIVSTDGWIPGTLILINSTITSNIADSDNNSEGNGGGVWRKRGTVTVENSIIAGNFDTPGNTGTGDIAPDVSGEFTSNGYNLIGDASGSTGFAAIGDKVGTSSNRINPLLAPLQNNGGSVFTHALLPGSPAINAGNNALVAEINDARGTGFARIAGDRVDIGAYEAQINLVISEIMHAPANIQPAWEWVEIYNAGNTTIDLTGFVFDDGDDLPLSAANISSGSITAGGTAILYNADAITAADFTAAWGTGINLVPVTNWAELDSSDRVGLWESFLNYQAGFDFAVDNVTYNSTQAAGDNSAASIYLSDISADNNTGTYWQTSILGATTPTFKVYKSALAGGNSGLEIASPGATDSTAPTASLTVANITAAGGTIHTFTVEYRDNRAVDVSTLGNTDITVISPSGEELPATLTDITLAGNGTPVTATCRVTAPGGTWDSADDGTYTVRLRSREVSDTTSNFISSGSLGTFRVNLDAANTNNPPKFTTQAVTSATEDAVYIYHIAAADVDAGDALAISALTLPPWLTLTDNRDGTAVLTGTPSNDNIGSQDVEIKVRDKGGDFEIQKFAIAVANVNDAPIVAHPIGVHPISDRAATEKASFTFTLAADTFSDVDAGDTLILTATLAGGNPLPSWLSFNAATATFSGTPTTSDVGTIAITVTATDSAGASASDTFEVAIAPLNTPLPDSENSGKSNATVPSLPSDFLVNSGNLDSLPPNPNSAPAVIDFIDKLPPSNNLSSEETPPPPQPLPDASLPPIPDSANAVEPISAVIEAITKANLTPEQNAIANTIVTALPANELEKVKPEDVEAIDKNFLVSALAGTNLETAKIENITALAANLSNSGVLPSGIGLDPAVIVNFLSENNLDAASLLREAKQLLGDGADEILASAVDSLDSLDCDCEVCAGTSAIAGDISWGNEENALDGGESNDTIVGGSENDAIAGLGGDDMLAGSAGGDVIFGGSGSEVSVGNLRECDRLFGNEGNDVLCSNEGADTVFGGQGNDISYGGKDEDMLVGDRGDDMLAGDKGNDTICGGTLDAEVGDSNGRDLLAGGSGDDFIFGNEGEDTLCGGEGNDVAHAGQNDDRICSAAGDDELFGEKGNDTLMGDEGNDTLVGGKGSSVAISSQGDRDFLCGGSGNDLIFGSEGMDVANGGEGDDSIYGGKDSDLVSGGEGNDWLCGEKGDDLLKGGLGSDRFILLAGNESETILDFEEGTDLLLLGGGLSFEQLAITATDGSALIRAASTDELLATLSGVAASAIGADDFQSL